MLKLKPVTLAKANEFVWKYHRHHKPSISHKFSIGCSDEEKLVGVAICGRPVSRMLDDGDTLEVNRLCTDGTRNACSFLYSACARAAKAMGYTKIITYVLESENGISLKASGWQCDGIRGGKKWNARPRPVKQSLFPSLEKQPPEEMKVRWFKDL